MDDKELILAARHLVYSVIARAYVEEPDQAFLEALLGYNVAIAVELLSEEPQGELISALNATKVWIKQDGSDGLPTDMLSLQSEYVRVFIGPGALPAAPWESMHLKSTHSSCQSEVLEVRNAYRRAGLLPARYKQVADDFIGLEFDFMAHLASRASERFGESDTQGCCEALEQSLSFLQGHLLKWIDDLAQAIRDTYGECFYATVTEFAALFVKQDAVMVSRLLASTD